MNWEEFKRARVSRLPIFPSVYVNLTWRYSDAAIFVVLWLAIDIFKAFNGGGFLR